jgi:hypothetical protein
VVAIEPVLNGLVLNVWDRVFDRVSRPEGPMPPTYEYRRRLLNHQKDDHSLFVTSTQIGVGFFPLQP